MVLFVLLILESWRNMFKGMIGEELFGECFQEISRFCCATHQKISFRLLIRHLVWNFGIQVLAIIHRLLMRLTGAETTCWLLRFMIKRCVYGGKASDISLFIILLVIKLVFRGISINLYCFQQFFNMIKVVWNNNLRFYSI